MIAAVAGKDLRTLWASPVPYVVGALFHAVLSLLYVDQLEVRRQAVMQPFFPYAAFLLVITTPVLAMRSLAEEARTGSLDLLQAIPVATSALAVGKWLAVWATALVVLAPSALFVVLLQWFGNPDAGPVVAGFLGLALLAAALAAIGVAASAATASQPVAAMVGLFVGLALWFAASGPDAGLVEEVLARLSFSERLRGFAGGLLDSGDAAYFVLLSGAGLVAAAAAVDGRRLR